MSDDCKSAGGTWPTEAPYNGGPYPTKTWAVFKTPCPNYTKYSVEQINMRRKAEVLKYKNNKSDVSKKLRYAYFAKNRNTKLLGSEQANTTSESCKTNSSASDVPGNKMLFLDKSVPVFGLVKTIQYGASQGNYPIKPKKLPVN